ncbi:MAG TPA: D-amino-acid transaminase, partial [Stellaceae bacterium]|nr:D-amino-acid transaminase [Stellaceae bacterium]
MSRIAYVNGRYLPHRAASVHIEDRGYQFADGVYEVIAVQHGALVDEDLHLRRLERSLRELRISEPMTESALKTVMREVIRRNRVRDGIIYLQMTRGASPRDHAFPKSPVTQVVMTARRGKPPSPEAIASGVRVISIPDQRWARCDIKSVSLLPNVLGKQQAREAGAYEAWQIDGDGNVTEGTSTNAWIVTEKGEVVTRQASEAILNGITRLAVIRVLEEHQLRLVERAFSLAEAKRAREAFITSTTAFVLPVVRIDDTVVADGKPGSLTRRLHDLYAEHVEAE